MELALFDVNRDVHGTRRRQRGPGQQCLRLAAVRKRTSENPNFDSECFAEMLCVELDLNGFGALLCFADN